MAEKKHSPAADRPLMMLRFRIGQESGEIWKRTFAQLKKYPDCCDEVWFSTGLSVVPLDTHRKLSAAMAENAKQLRRIGIIPSLQFQSTIGHSDSISAPYYFPETGALLKDYAKQSLHIQGICPMTSAVKTLHRE